MPDIVDLRYAEYFVPQMVKRLLLPAICPDRNPFDEHTERHQAIFVHVPKTAGSSVHRAIGSTTQRHAPLSRFAAYDPKRTARFFKFCFVRNPWDRLLSAFSYLSNRDADPKSHDVQWARRNLYQYRDFDDFVRALERPLVRLRVMSYKHFIPQFRWLTVQGSPGLKVDHIGRFESLGDDFSLIAGKLGIDANLSQERVGSHTPYQSAYNDETRAIVERVYARDITQFGYRFDGHLA